MIHGDRRGKSRTMEANAPGRKANVPPPPKDRRGELRTGGMEMTADPPKWRAPPKRHSKFMR